MNYKEGLDHILTDRIVTDIDALENKYKEQVNLSFQAAMDYYEAKYQETRTKLENLFIEYQAVNNKIKK
jgi:hypothetical protein